MLRHLYLLLAIGAIVLPVGLGTSAGAAPRPSTPAPSGAAASSDAPRLTVVKHRLKNGMTFLL